MAMVLDSSDNVFGVTGSGGANNSGVFFELPVNQQTANVLAPFDAPGAGGGISFPNSLVVFNGNFYGTTSGGGTLGHGSVFEIPGGTTTIETRGSFAGIPDGSNPTGGPFVDSLGNIFGTTSNGGTQNLGTIYKIPVNTSTVQTLASFDDTDGFQPQGNLIADSDGNLFGTTIQGGANRQGVVFELALNAHTPTVLASFDAAHGIGPQTGLTADGSGNFFGTTTAGGINNTGVVFELSPSNGGGGGGGGGGSGTITSAVARTSLSSTFVPGDRATATITLTNGGGALTRGVALVQLFLTPDGVPADGTQLTTPTLNHIPVILGAGKSRPVPVSFLVPQTVTLGNEQLVAVVTAVSGFANLTVDSTPAVQTGAETAALDFGNVSGRRAVRLVDTIGGNKATFILAGPGTGALNPDGLGGFSLALTGTTAASSLVVIAPIGTALSGITTDSAIGVVNAIHIVDNGNLSLPGGARFVLMSNLNNGAITIGGASPTILSLGNLVNTSIASSAPLISLTVASFTNTGTALSITAPRLTVFTDRGDFAGNLASSGNITVTTIRGNLTGDILAGTSLGLNQEPGGGDDVFTAGNITVLHMFGSVTSSTIAAGLNLDVGNDVFPLNGHETLLAGSRITALTIGGVLSDDSKVLADKLPVRAFVDHVLVTPAGDPRFAV